MTDNTQSQRVLITGGTGFIGSHCILQTLQAGYRVRTTVRSLDREDQLREMIRVGGVDPADRLEVIEANLLADEGWDEAVAGCDYVLHVASPFPSGQPDDEMELIRPARQGTLRVLRAARDAGVKRVVVTSSVAAVAFGHPPRDEPFTEEDWTVADAEGIPAYIKSKTLAERAAWEFMEEEGGAMEMAVVNPVLVFGPVLGDNVGTSVKYVQAIADGSRTEFPMPTVNGVDVRDVADLHLRAMTDPAAAGERFIATAGPSIEIQKIQDVLRERFGDRLPDMKPLKVGDRGPAGGMQVSNEKAKRVLGWDPMSNEQSVVDTAQSLLDFGFV